MATKTNSKTSKTTAKKTATKRNKPHFNYKDLIILAMGEGVEALEALVAQEKVPLAMVKKAAASMAKSDLKEAMLALIPAPARRGRAAPAAGESREYSVQAGKWIRLPIESLAVNGVTPKRVSVTINEDGSINTNRSASAPAVAATKKAA